MPLRVAAFPCCRAHDLFAPVEEYGKSILCSPGDEAYWFNWSSSFHGEATIRVANLGAEASISRLYRPSKYGKLRRYQAWLTPGEWSRLEDAITAANFWMLDEHSGRHGLDGSTWRFAGRRRRDYHFISRWCPEGALWDLGRLFFDLAGLAEISPH
jgi:hypothetical protein